MVLYHYLHSKANVILMKKVCKRNTSGSELGKKSWFAKNMSEARKKARCWQKKNFSFVLLLRFTFCTYLMYSQKTNLNLLIKNLIIEGWMMKRTGILTITIMITDIMCFYLIEEITASRYSYKTAFLNSSKKFWENLLGSSL